MYDVAIIGAGFAGANLASKFENLDVIVIDKSLGNKDVSAITFIDVVEGNSSDAANRAIKSTYSKFTLFNTLGDIIEYSFDQEIFCLVDYSKLCKNIWNDVVNAEVISYSGNLVVTKDEKIKARVIADCSGIGGESLRAANKIQLPPVINALAFQQLKNPEVNKDTFYLIMGFANFGGWIYPHGRGAEFGMANRFKRGAELTFPDLQMAKELEAVKRFTGSEEGGEVLKVTYPYGFVKKVVYGNTVLLGDSAGLTHPVYGMSLHYISHMSAILATIIKEYIKGTTKLSDYQRYWRSFISGIRTMVCRGYAIWDMPLEIQENLVRLQKRMDVSPRSILEDIRGLRKYDVYAKNPPSVTDYPVKLLLKVLFYWFKSLFWI